MLSRFPEVRLISVENGGSWVGVLLKNLELAYKKMPQEFAEHPLEVFGRNVWVNPFWEESVAGLIELIGPERVCFGSDYPHPEGMEDPTSWRDELGDLPSSAVEQIMSSNMFELMRLTRPVRTAPSASRG
jgi:predicted TIM-barrel fold metal-dependent hydrolase